MKVTRPTPAHFGIYVYDLDKMVEFYTRVFRLTITDQGIGKNFGNRLVFMSATEDQHHQFVLSAGRAKDSPSTIMQASFLVPDLEELRWNRDQAAALGATQIQPMNHGNAWSVYYFDPEGNRVEVYMDTPYYVNQPYGVPLDLNKTEAELLQETEAMVRDDPSFMLLADWQAQFRQRGTGAR